MVLVVIKTAALRLAGKVEDYPLQRYNPCEYSLLGQLHPQHNPPVLP